MNCIIFNKLVSTLDEIKYKYYTKKYLPIHEIEIECRFGYIHKHKFNPNVNENLYRKIINELYDNDFEIKEEETIDTFYKYTDNTGNLRNTKFIKPENKVDELIVKNKIKNIDIPISNTSGVSNLRISLARETKIDPIKVNSDKYKVIFKRKKKRISFIDGIFTIDISEVITDNIISYEIEIEILNLHNVLNTMETIDIAKAYYDVIELILDVVGYT